MPAYQHEQGPSLPGRPQRLLRRYRWRILGVVAIVGLALSFVGLWNAVYSAEGTASGALASAAYQSLLGLWFNLSASGNVPWTLQIGRLLTLASAATVGGGLVLEVLRDENQRGRARGMRGHVIVCGLGTLGAAAADSVLNEELDLTIVDNTSSPATESFARRGAGIVIGDATDPFTLMEAGADRARFLLACCGSDDLNASVAEAARVVIETVGRSERPLVSTPSEALSVRVHIDEPDLLRQLRPCILELSAPGIDVDFFSVAEVAASRIVDPVVQPEQLLGTTEFDVVVIGDTILAEEIVLSLARAASRNDGRIAPPVVALASEHADAFQERISARGRRLIAHLDLRPLSLAASNREPSAVAALTGEGAPRYRVAYVCTEDDGLTVTVALALTSAARIRPVGFRVVSCIYGRSGIASLVERASSKTLTVFDVADAVRGPRLVTLDTYEILARIGHAGYMAVESRKPSAARTVEYLPWDELDEETRENNRSQIRSFVERIAEAHLRMVPLADEDESPTVIDRATVERLAVQEHIRWMKYKIDQGWKPCAKGERSKARKLHDCLIAWEELDEAERDKDRRPILEMATRLKEAGIALVHDDLPEV